MMLIVSTIFALQATAVEPQHVSSTALTDSVVAAELRFFSRWSEAWRKSAADQYTRPRPTKGEPYYSSPWWLTQEDAVCHREGPWQTSSFQRYALPYMILDGVRRISSSQSWHSVCPGWFRGEGEPPGDERLGIDSALTQPRRDSIRVARSRLLAFLDSAVRIEPANEFLIGQQVRLLVDQQDIAAAIRVATACRPEASWCAALTGYAYASNNEIIKADSSFKAALKRMTTNERCTWNDLSALLESAERKLYSLATCDARDSLNARIWWLANPLYTYPGNVRRVDQNVRRVQVALRSAVFRDERRDWRKEVAGDALREMIDRYGWPAYSALLPYERYDHMAEFLLRSQPIVAPMTSYEYSRDRVHLFPEQRLLESPFRSKVGDWNFSPPANMAEDGNVWWPREHASLPYSLLPLPDVQSAMLRRDHGALFAVAADLDPTLLQRNVTEGVEAAIVVSPGPDSVHVVERRPAVVGATTVLSGLIGPGPYVAGFEIMPGKSRRGPAARARFGIEPPAALSEMKRGEFSISAPVILRNPGTDKTPSSNPDSALASMAGSSTVSTGRLGIYWETYGFQRADTVELSVWIERYTPQGIFRRLGTSLGVAQDMNTPVVVTWTEPQSGNQTHMIAGNVPIIGRSVVLDVSALPKGDYWLDVGASLRGAEPVHGRRSFTIR
jgi:hypothetical protein